MKEIMFSCVYGPTEKIWAYLLTCMSRKYIVSENVQIAEYFHNKPLRVVLLYTALSLSLSLSLSLQFIDRASHEIAKSCPANQVKRNSICIFFITIHYIVICMNRLPTT